MSGAAKRPGDGRFNPLVSDLPDQGRHPRNTLVTDAPVQIPVVGAAANGVTPIAAFDAALLACGVGDVNLVSLSSIIPPGHSVAVIGDLPPADQPGFGDLTFAVMAEARAESGPAAAGLAWVNSPDHSGGLFLEGHGTDAGRIEADLKAGLHEMIAARPERPLDPGDIKMHIVSAPPSDEPICALVVAVFEARPFNQ